MDKITYLDHSGFMIQTADVLMVFDYYRDPAHKVSKTLEHNPDMPVVFFVSHRHNDHFSHQIWDLGQNHKRLYIVSNDVDSKEVHSDMPVNWMSPGDILEDQLGGIRVKAYGTTGKGCSFAVTTKDGRHIFHAGELGEPISHNDDAPRDIARFNEKFDVAVNRIASSMPSFDLAMMSVNTVDGPDFALGATKFLEKVNVGSFVPYHTNDSSDKACNFAAYPFNKKVETKLVCLTSPGESADF